MKDTFSRTYTNVNSLGQSDGYMRGKLTTIGSDNGLSPVRRQAIIQTNTGILLIGPLGTNFGEILIEIQTSTVVTTHDTVMYQLQEQHWLQNYTYISSVKFLGLAVISKNPYSLKPASC